MGRNISYYDACQAVVSSPAQTISCNRRNEYIAIILRTERKHGDAKDQGSTR